MNKMTQFVQGFLTLPKTLTRSALLIMDRGIIPGVKWTGFCPPVAKVGGADRGAAGV